MLNSRNYSRDPEVLNIGQEVASEVDLKDPATKVYYHQVKGACTHLPDGAQITFRGGMYATQNEEVIRHLDKIANKQGSMVYTKQAEKIAQQIEQLTAVSDARAPAGNALKTIGTGDDGKLQEVQNQEAENAALASARQEEQPQVSPQVQAMLEAQAARLAK